jgi:hypothetical protein
VSERINGVNASMRQDVNKTRPWSIKALVLLGVVGLITGVIAAPNRGWGDLVGGLFTIWIAYSLWIGKAWAFTISFMAATLCAGLVLVIAGVQAFLFEQRVHEGVLLALLSSAVWIALLLHPATKEFAGLRKESPPQVNGPKA